MMNWIVTAIAALLVFVVTPGAGIAGWYQWARAERQSGVAAKLCLAGFATASASALLAIVTLLLSARGAGFAYYDPFLIQLDKWGLGIASVGFLLSLSGVWRRSVLRWYAPLLSFGVLVFWLIAINGE